MNKLTLDKCLTLDDVLLVPQLSNINSRSDIDTSTQLTENFKLKVPVISSPMDTVTEAAMAIALSEAGGLGILHRSCSLRDQVLMIDNILEYEELNNKIINWGAAVGITDDYLERAKAMHRLGCSVICIDVAHGHHTNVRKAILSIRNSLGDKIHIMAGSVATLEAFDFLAEAGASSGRCSIGSGSICSTRLQTGHGVPLLSAIFDCAKSTSDMLLIADGGLRTPGDIVKAIAAGADAVMLGSMLAGTLEAPGQINSDGKKQYRGMASFESQVDRGNKNPMHVEGVSGWVNITGTVKSTIEKIHAGLTSGMSYSGARTIHEFQLKAKFIQQTHVANIEGPTGI